jgi:MFS family permease
MLGTYNTFGVFLKPLAADLGWTRATVSGAYSLAFLLYGFLGIFAGRLTDKFGPKVVAIGCGVFLGLGYSLLSQLSSVWQFYLFYGIIVGAGMSGGDIPVLATVARWFVKRRGILTGIAKAGAGVGMFTVPLLAGWSIASYGWRNAYLLIASLALVGIVSVAMLFKRDPQQMGQLPDGAAKVEEVESKVEIRQYSLREVTATRQFWIFSAIWFVIAFVTISMLGHVAAHATDVGISTTTATTVLSMIGGASVIGRVGMGGISDRLGNKKTLFITLLMLVAALVLIMFAREAWMFYLFALLQGISHGAAYTLISPLLAELFGLGSLGEILGVVVFIGTIGGAIGPILAGRTFDVTNGYQPFFLLCLGLSIAAIILLSFLKQTKISSGS